MKKWGQAPRVGMILPVIRIGRRSQSPFFHKLGASYHISPFSSDDVAVTEKRGKGSFFRGALLSQRTQGSTGRASGFEMRSS